MKKQSTKSVECVQAVEDVEASTQQNEHTIDYVEFLKHDKLKRRKRKQLKASLPEKLTDPNEGLTDDEVLLRCRAGLTNYTRPATSQSVAKILVSEIFTFFNVLYGIITFVLILLQKWEQMFFLVVILPNLLIGIYQKLKSKFIVEKLSLMIKSNATAIRGGQEVQISTDEIVRDDVLCYASGIQIPTDSVILNGECTVNESMLTGESLPVKKSVGDKLFAGSFLISGTCKARATSVGKDNYVQQLTKKAKTYRKPNSEILKSLHKIIKAIGFILIPIAILLYYTQVGLTFDEEVICSVLGAIVNMIPSGMFLLTTTTLAFSVIRLSKRKILVQELYCIEMLARVNLVCMDKTGTITDGSMVVRELVPLVEKYNKPFNEIIGNLLNQSKDDNATSKALKKHFECMSTFNCDKYYSFSSETKFMAGDYGKNGTYYLGAPEFLTKDVEVLALANEYASKGCRVLLLSTSAKYNETPKGYLKDLALIVLEDNIRPDAIKTISYFKKNGVGLKVISGDNPLTVAEVAKRAGVEGAEKYISLQGLSDSEVELAASEYNIFGRVSPQQKEILIKALKNAGNTVAMIGDGVNDILALREADCSIGMGEGSEASRNVSHLILLDNKFSSMQNIVAEGRRTTNNLQTVAILFLTKTILCITLSLICIVTRIQYPFYAQQLLLLEFFGIGLPGFCYALQQNKNIIKGKFLNNVLMRAWNFALAGLLFTVPLYFFEDIFGIDSIRSMLVLILTFNLIWVVLRLSLPFNKFRFGVFSIVVIGAIAGFFCITTIFGPYLTLFDILKLTPLNTVEIIICIQSILILPNSHRHLFWLNNVIVTNSRKNKNKKKNKFKSNISGLNFNL